MTKIIYKTVSPYALTPQSNWSIGLYNHRSIPSFGDDRAYTIERKYHNRPDWLAYHLYGDSELYWVFMVRNMNVIRDPIWDFEEGVEIYITSKENLKKTLGL